MSAEPTETEIQKWAEREDRVEAESEKLRHWLLGRAS